MLDVTPNVSAWCTRGSGGHDANAGYGSRLDTVVEWTLTKVDGGTRLRLVHSGFRTPKNDFAFKNMSEGWPKALQKISAVAVGEHDSSKAKNPNQIGGSIPRIAPIHLVFTKSE